VNIVPKQWFANRGQILQIVLGVIAIGVAVVLHTGVPTAPTWLVPAAFGTAVGVALSWGIGRLFRSEHPIPNSLKFVSSDVVSDDREEITDKRKLYLIFRNDSDGEIVVGPKTGWIDGDLHVKTLTEHVWQVEGPRGWRNGDWTKEAVAIRVLPGKYLRTWVGLPNNATKTDVDRSVAEHRAGALACSVVRGNEIKIDI
jgi:hypothetical protein